ncbi:MAG: OmpH family outer membrane protein [Flavobacteriaceae bacterium]
MIKKHIYIALFLALISQLSFAQKAQRFAYIDMAFVLENIPEYNKAQNQLDSKVKAWQRRLDREKNDIEALKKDFSNEKALLTPELIQEREDDIFYKEQDYKKLQEAYFGPKGDLYLYRKLLVQPIQDKVYNFIQEIAVKKRYDFVIDKSSDLILLYTNKRYDISDLVVNNIVRERKKKAIQAKRKKAKNTVSNKTAKTSRKPSRFGRISRKKSSKKNLKNTVVNKKIAVDKKATVTNISNKDTLTVVKTVEKDTVTVATKPLEENTNVLKEAPSNDVLKRIEARNAKRKVMLEKIRLAKEAKTKKKIADRKAALDKRAARIKELEKYKEELIRKRDSAQQAKKDKKEKKDN